MGRLKNIFSSFIYRIHEDCDDEVANKILLINLFSLVFFTLFLILGITGILISRLEMASIFFFSAILIIANSAYLLKYRKCKPSGHFLVLLISVVFLFILISGGISGSVYLLMVTYPAIALFLMGTRIGSLITLGMFLLTTSILLIPENQVIHPHIALEVYLPALVTYAIVYLLVLFYMRVNIMSLRKLEKEMLQAKIDNNRKDDFISKLSHQIRTPLNNLMVVNELLEASTLDDDQKDLLNTLIASTNNLVSIVNNISKVSNLEMTEQKEYKLSFNLYSTIQNTLRLFKDRLAGNIDIKTQFDPALKDNLIGDPVRVKQIFINLVESLSKYLRNKKGFIKIRINLERENEELINLVFNIDTNPIPQSIIRLGKQPYLEPDAGNGPEVTEDELIDLSLALSLIESKGGKFNISSTLQKTTFSFTLEFFKLQVAKQEFLKEKVIPLVVTPAIRKEAKDLIDSNLLLVEDNLINQKIVLLSLRKLVRNIDIANNGKEALDKFGTSKYDLILMDIQMPVMDGIVATKKIREIESSTSSITPIIAITANALSGDREICLAAGANEYISKPFQIDVLIQKIKDLISQAS